MHAVRPSFFAKRAPPEDFFDALPRGPIVTADQVLRGPGLERVQSKLSTILGVRDPAAPGLVVTRSATKSGNGTLLYMAHRPEFVVVRRSDGRTVSILQLIEELKDSPQGHLKFRVTLPDQTVEALIAHGKAGQNTRGHVSAGVAMRLAMRNAFEEPASLKIETKCIGEMVKVELELTPQPWLQSPMARFGMRSDFTIHRMGCVPIAGRPAEKARLRAGIDAQKSAEVAQVAALFVQDLCSSRITCPDLAQLHRCFFIAEATLMGELVTAFDGGGRPRLRDYEGILQADPGLLNRLADHVIRNYPPNAWQSDQWAGLT